MEKKSKQRGIIVFLGGVKTEAGMKKLKMDQNCHFKNTHSV